MGVTRPFSFISLLLNTIGNYVMKWKLLQENELRKSGLPYLIVRPGGERHFILAQPSHVSSTPPPPHAGLTNKMGLEERVEFLPFDSRSGRISREAVANICIRALSMKNLPTNATVNIIAKQGKWQDDAEFEEAFAAIKADSGSLPSANHEAALYTIYSIVALLVALFFYYFFFR